MDTREGLGVPIGLRSPGSSTDLLVAGANGVPADATAVVLNATITESVGAGFVQLFPTGNGTPGASSNLNVVAPGVTIANLVIVPIGANGSVTFYASGGGHLLADLFGYFVPATNSAAGRFEALSVTSRVLDTRVPENVPIANPGDVMNCGDFTSWNDANVWFRTYERFDDPSKLDGDSDGVPCETLAGNPGHPVTYPDLFKLGDRGVYRLPITMSATPAGGVVPTGATAVVMNVTVAEATAPGFLQVFNDDAAKAASSNLNYGANSVAANLVIVPIGADGSVKLYVHSSTHVLVDVIGYFTGISSPASSHGLFVPFTPDRLIDTRDSGGPVPVGLDIAVPVAPLAGLNYDEVSAIYMNATIADSLGAGFINVHTPGTTPWGNSSVNVTGPGQFRANAVIVGLGGGNVSVFTSVGGGHWILDAAGYFTSGATGSGGGDTLLAQLVVAPQNTSVPYNRDDWPHWIDVDSDCQDTRAEVLIRDTTTSVTFTSVSQCTVAAGGWVDPWTGLTFTAASDVDIDHTVALGNAHRSGGWAWTTVQKREYANDLAHLDALRPVDDGTNIAKGDKGPDEWKPPLSSAWCHYATDWATIKIRWHLTVTTTEYAALDSMFGTC